MKAMMVGMTEQMVSRYNVEPGALTAGCTVRASGKARRGAENKVWTPRQLARAVQWH